MSAEEYGMIKYLYKNKDEDISKFISNGDYSKVKKNIKKFLKKNIIIFFFFKEMFLTLNTCKN